MKLRDLRKGRLAAWPPTWGGGAYDGRSLSDTGGENGVLVDVRAGATEPELVDARTGAVKSGVVVVMEQAGERQREVMEWDGPEKAPTPEQVAQRLQAHRGTLIGKLGEVEIGEQ
jgi:hypothetical protein